MSRILILAAIGLLLTEGVLRVGRMLHSRPRLLMDSDELGWESRRDLDLVFERPGYGEVQFSTSPLGFRSFGDPASEKVKLFAVGDSFTHAYQVSDGEAFYDVLAREHGGIEVFAYGVGGYGTLQELLILSRHLEEIDPEIILWQLSLNDLINNSFALESASSENNNHMLRPYLEDGQIVLAHPDGVLGWIGDRSLLGRRLLVLRDSILKRSVGSIECELTPGDPRVDVTLARTAELFRRAVRLVDGRPIVAFYVPSLDMMEFEVSLWETVCAVEGVLCVPDLEPALEEARSSGQSIDGGSDPHWNRIGHEVAGREILAFLRAENLVE